MDGELRVCVGRPSPNRQEFFVQTACYRDGSPLAVCVGRCVNGTVQNRQELGDFIAAMADSLIHLIGQIGLSICPAVIQVTGLPESIHVLVQIQHFYSNS